jgi:hypothetical protein
MAGRPKRAEAVTSLLLRLPPTLLARVERCKARMELREGASVSRTEALWRILEAGCEALEEQIPFAEAYPDMVPSAALISEISKEYEISKISEIPPIAGDQPEQPPPQAPRPPSHLATVEEPEPMATSVPPMAVPQAPAVPSPEAAPVEEVPQPTQPPMIPTGMHQCRYGHEPYPMSRKECPTCVRNRKQRQRQRQKEPA